MTKHLRSEDAALVAVAGWLVGRGWTLRRVSPFPWSAREHVERGLLAHGVDVGEVRFERHGYDMVAEREGTIWRVECKGAGDGKPSTLRNSFDRGLSSVACYHDPPAGAGLRLGLAFAEHRDYRWQIQTRVPPALRQILNLWLFVVMPDGEVKACAPDGDLTAAWPRVAPRRKRAVWRDAIGFD